MSILYPIKKIMSRKKRIKNTFLITREILVKSNDMKNITFITSIVKKNI